MRCVRRDSSSFVENPGSDIGVLNPTTLVFAVDTVPPSSPHREEKASVIEEDEEVGML